MHFSSYSLLNVSLLFDFIFQKFARQQSIFPDFSKPALEHAFLPVTSPNKHLEPVTLHKTELVWAGFLHLFSEAESSVVCSTSGEAWAPREDNILPVKPFSWPKHPKVDPTTLSLSRALRILMWSPRMELPARCFPVLLLHDLLSVLFSYLVNLLDGGIFFFSSPRKAMVRCSWKRTLGNTSAQSWSFVDSWGQLSSSTSGAYLRMCYVFLSEPRCFMSGRNRQAKLWNGEIFSN